MSSADGGLDHRDEDAGAAHDDGSLGPQTRSERSKRNQETKAFKRRWVKFEDTSEFRNMRGKSDAEIAKAKAAYDAIMQKKVDEEDAKAANAAYRRSTRVRRDNETPDDIALKDCAQGLRTLLLTIVDARYTLQRTDYQTTNMWSDLITLICNWFFPNTQRSEEVTSAAEDFAQKIQAYITEGSTEANGQSTLSHDMQEIKEYIISMTQDHISTLSGEAKANWFRVASGSEISKETILDRIKHWTKTRIRNCTRQISEGNYVSIEELKDRYLKSDNENMVFYRQTVSGSGTGLYDAIAEETDRAAEELERLVISQIPQAENEIEAANEEQYIPQVIKRPLWIFQYNKDHGDDFPLKLRQKYEPSEGVEAKPPVYLMYRVLESGKTKYFSLTRLTEVPAESTDGDTEQTGNNEVRATPKELSIDEKKARITREVSKYLREQRIIQWFHDKVEKYLLDKHANTFDELYGNFSFKNVSERAQKQKIQQKIIEEALVYVVQKSLPKQVEVKLQWLKADKGKNCKEFYDKMLNNPLNNGLVIPKAVTWPVNADLELDPNWILDIVRNILPDEFLDLATSSKMQKWLTHPFRATLQDVTKDRREFYLNSKIMEHLENTKKLYFFVEHYFLRDYLRNFPMRRNLEFKYKVINEIMRYYDNAVKNSFEDRGTDHDRMEIFVGEVIYFVNQIEKLDNLEEKLKSVYRRQTIQRIEQEMEEIIREIISDQVRVFTRSKSDTFLRIITERLIENLMTAGQNASIKTKFKLFLDPAYQNQRNELIEKFEHPAVNEELQHIIHQKVISYFDDQEDTFDSSTLEQITNSIMLEVTEAENEDERIRLRELFMNDDKQDACNAKIQYHFDKYKELHWAQELEPVNRDELAAETTHDHDDHVEGSHPSVEEAVNAAVTGFMMIRFYNYLNKDLHAKFVNWIMDDDLQKLELLFLDINKWRERELYLQEKWHFLYESEYALAPSLERQEQTQLEDKVRQAITAFFRLKNINTSNNNLAGELFDMIMKYDLQKVEKLFQGHTEWRSKKIFMDRVWDFVNDVKLFDELESNNDEGARNQLGKIIYKQVEYYFLRHKYNLGLLPRVAGMLLHICYEDNSQEGTYMENRQSFLNPANESGRDKQIQDAVNAMEQTSKDNPDRKSNYELHPETVPRLVSDDAIEDEYITDDYNTYNQYDDYEDHDKGNTTENKEYEDKYKSMLANLSNKPRKDKNGRPHWNNVGDIEKFREKCRGHEAEPLTIEVTEIKEKFEKDLQQLTTQKELSLKDAYTAFQLAFKSIVNKSLTNLKGYMLTVVGEMEQTNFHQVQSQWPKMISGSWDRWHWCVDTFREMVRSVMANDSKESEKFFSDLIEEYKVATRRSLANERMMLLDVVGTNIYPDQINTKSIHTIRYVETIPKGVDIDNQQGKRSKYFMPYNNMNPANLLNCEIYLDKVNVSNGWRNDILKQFARMKNAWMRTFVQTLKERADIGWTRLKVMNESLFQFKLDPVVVQQFVDDMRMSEEENKAERQKVKKLKKAPRDFVLPDPDVVDAMKITEEEREEEEQEAEAEEEKEEEEQEAEENNRVPRRYFVLPEGCLRITSNNFSDPKLGEQFQAFLAKFYPRYVQDRKWYNGESMARARQLFTARYRAAFFEAVYIYTRIDDKDIDMAKFEKDHEKVLKKWKTQNKTSDEINSAIRDTVKKERANKAWAKLPDEKNPHILIYGAQIANPYLVSEAGNPFMVCE